MTLLNSDIKFNNVDGSETASGCGPSVAISGTGASTNGTVSVDLSADTPNLSTVSVGDLLWVATSSGRQFSAISGIDDGTDIITCDNVYTGTESGLTWGIGGKRADPLSTNGRQLLQSDAHPGWTIDIENAGVDYNTGASGSIVTIGGSDTADGNANEGMIILKSSSPKKPTFLFDKANPNVNSFFRILGNFWRLEHLKFDISAGDATIVNGILDTDVNNEGQSCQFIDLEITSHNLSTTVAAIRSSQNTNAHTVHIERCFIHCDNGEIDDGIELTNTQNNDNSIITLNVISGMASEGIDIQNNPMVITNNIVRNCGLDGIRMRGNSRRSYIANNIIYSNDLAGISLEDQNLTSSVMHNIIVNNGTYGISTNTTTVSGVASIDFNAYYNNTSGTVNTNFGLAIGPNDIVLSGDPFVDPNNGDFNLNTTANAGQALRDAILIMPTGG